MYDHVQPLSRAHSRLLQEPLLILGETDFRRIHRRFGMLAADRLRHLWIIGKTGSGKSTLMANLIAQDLARGMGVALLDPHGDLVEAVLPFVPASRTNQVVLFAPADRAHPISFNVFRQGRQSHPDQALLASQLVSVFKKHWSDSWGPRLEHILRNGILAVAGDPRATLLFLYRFLTEEKLRAAVAGRLADQLVRQFWREEFPRYGKALQSEALAPVLNKLGAFVAHPVVRAIVSQERSRLDLIALLETRGIVLANLAAGRIGEDASHLLGGLLLSAIQLAAMERPRGGPPCIVYVDEFQHFVTDSLATLLAESRKFGIGLVLAHQYLGQLPDGLRGAVLGNVGSMVVFRLGAHDAETLEPEFAPTFSAYDLQRFERYHAAIKLLAEGQALTPFSARMLPLPPPPAGTAERIERIRTQSRLRFSNRSEAVEAAVAHSLRNDPKPHRSAVLSVHLTAAGQNVLTGRRRGGIADQVTAVLGPSAQAPPSAPSRVGVCTPNDSKGPRPLARPATHAGGGVVAADLGAARVASRGQAGTLLRSGLSPALAAGGAQRGRSLSVAESELTTRSAPAPPPRARASTSLVATRGEKESYQ